MIDPEACAAVEAAFAAAMGATHLDHKEGFFDLGVDSLVIVKAMASLRERWPFLRPVDVFDYPTIESLATFISTRSASQA
jgi:aryl carrier-like protein